MSEVGPQVNGLASPTGKYIDHIDPDDPEYIKNLQRPAEVKEDLQQMENRSRVKVILNSQAFKEELEQVVEEQLRNGPFPTSLIALQQITDLLLPHSKGGLGSLARASAVIPINDLRGVESQSFVKGERLLRCKLAALYRLVDLCGWSHGIYNHISARVSSENEHFLLNPFGLTYSEVTASTLIKVDVNGDVVDPGSTQLGPYKAGFLVHAAIHQARPDIKCIVHLHTPAAVAVSALKCGLLPMSQEALLCGKISYHDFQGVSMDAEEHDKLARNLGVHNKVLILRNRGVLSCGETVEEAFHYTFNIMAACEAQVKAIPLGLDNIVIPSDEAREQAHKTVTSQGPGDPKERKWKVGELEFEALMRTLDNSGYRTGYPYKMPVVKQERKERSNSEVEIPPSSSSFTYIFDGDYVHSKYASPLQAAKDRQKIAFKAGWLTTPNSYKKTEIDEIGTTNPKKITKWVSEGDSPGKPGSTHIKIENPNQFAPQGVNPKEYKEKQKSIKKDYYEEKVTAGPQSKILEGITWDEAQKAKDGLITGAGDQLIIVGAASKGIIQRDHQHNAVVYRQYYAANPFENMSEAEIEKYQSEVQRKERGEPEVEEQVQLSPVVVEAPIIEQPPEPEKEEMQDVVGVCIDVTDTLIEPTRPEVQSNGYFERATNDFSSGQITFHQRKVQTSHILDKTVTDFIQTIKEPYNLMQQTLTATDPFTVEQISPVVQEDDHTFHCSFKSFKDSISCSKTNIGANDHCSNENCNDNNKLEFYKNISNTKGLKNSGNISWSNVIEADKIDNSSHEDDSVSIQLNPIHLYHNRCESGVMKVKFSVQSSVRRTIRSELSRGGGWDVEDMFTSVSEPLIEHFPADESCLEQSFGLCANITKISVKKGWRKERQSTRCKQTVQIHTDVNTSDIFQESSFDVMNDIVEGDEQYNSKFSHDTKEEFKSNCLDRTDNSISVNLNTADNTDCPIIDTGQKFNLNTRSEKQGKQAPDRKEDSGGERSGSGKVMESSTSEVEQSKQPARDSEMIQNSTDSQNLGLRQWNESWNKDATVMALSLYPYYKVLEENIKYADEEVVDEDFDQAKKQLEEKLKHSEIQTQINSTFQKVKRKKRIFDRKQMPPPPLPPLIKAKNSKSKKISLKQNIKQSYPPLSPVKEEFGSTAEEMEEMEAILEVVDDSFEQLLISAEDDLLIKPKIEPNISNKTLLVTNVKGAAPMAVEDDFDSHETSATRAANYIGIELSSGAIVGLDFSDTSNPSLIDNLIHLPKFSEEHFAEITDLQKLDTLQSRQEDKSDSQWSGDIEDENESARSKDDNFTDSLVLTQTEINDTHPAITIEVYDAHPHVTIEASDAHPSVTLPAQTSYSRNSVFQETLKKIDPAVAPIVEDFSQDNNEQSSDLKEGKIEVIPQTHTEHINLGFSNPSSLDNMNKYKTDSGRDSKSEFVKSSTSQSKIINTCDNSPRDRQVSNISYNQFKIVELNGSESPSEINHMNIISFKNTEANKNEIITSTKSYTGDIFLSTKVETIIDDIIDDTSASKKTNIDTFSSQNTKADSDDITSFKKKETNINDIYHIIPSKTTALNRGGFFISSRTSESFAESVGPQIKCMSRLEVDEGPVQTSSPKMGRAKSKESPFKPYLQKLGKSEETLLDIMPLEGHNGQVVAKSQEQLENNVGDYFIKLPLSRSKSLGPHHVNKKNQKQLYKKHKETSIHDFLDSNRSVKNYKIAVLDEYNLKKHSQLMELSKTKATFKPLAIRTHTAVGDAMSPLPDTTEVPSVSDNEGQPISEDYSQPLNRESRMNIVTSANSPALKQKWVPKQKRERRRQNRNPDNQPACIHTFNHSKDRERNIRDTRKLLEKDSEKFSQSQMQNDDGNSSSGLSINSRNRLMSNLQTRTNEEKHAVNERHTDKREYGRNNLKEKSKNYYRTKKGKDKGYQHDIDNPLRVTDQDVIKSNINSRRRKSSESRNKRLSDNMSDDSEKVKETVVSRSSSFIDKQKPEDVNLEFEQFSVQSYHNILPSGNDLSWNGSKLQQVISETHQIYTNTEKLSQRNKDLETEISRQKSERGWSRRDEKQMISNEKGKIAEKKEINIDRVTMDELKDPKIDETAETTNNDKVEPRRHIKVRNMQEVSRRDEEKFTTRDRGVSKIRNEKGDRTKDMRETIRDVEEIKKEKVRDDCKDTNRYESNEIRNEREEAREKREKKRDTRIELQIEKRVDTRKDRSEIKDFRDNRKEIRRYNKDELPEYDREYKNYEKDETSRDMGSWSMGTDETSKIIEKMRRDDHKSEQSMEKWRDKHRHRSKCHVKESEIIFKQQNTVHLDKDIDRFENNQNSSSSNIGFCDSQIFTVENLDECNHEPDTVYRHTINDKSCNKEKLSKQSIDKYDSLKTINSISKTNASDDGTQHLLMDARRVSEKGVSLADVFLKSNHGQIDPESSPRLQRRRGGAIAYPDDHDRRKSKKKYGKINVMDNNLQNTQEHHVDYNFKKEIREDSGSNHKSKENKGIRDNKENKLNNKSPQKFLHSSELNEELHCIVRSDPSLLESAYLEKLDDCNNFPECAEIDSPTGKPSTNNHLHIAQTMDNQNQHQSDMSRFREKQHTRDNIIGINHQQEKVIRYKINRNNNEATYTSDEEITGHTNESSAFSETSIITEDLGTVLKSNIHQQSMEAEESERDLQQKYSRESKIKSEHEIVEVSKENKAKAEYVRSQKGLVKTRGSLSDEDESKNKKRELYKDGKTQKLLQNETVIKTKSLESKCLSIRKAKNSSSEEEAVDEYDRNVAEKSNIGKDGCTDIFSKSLTTLGDKEVLYFSRSNSIDVSESHVLDERRKNRGTSVDKENSYSNDTSVGVSKSTHDNNVFGSSVERKEKQKYAGFIKRTGRSISKSHPVKDIIIDGSASSDHDCQFSNNEESLAKYKTSSPQNKTSEDHVNNSLIHGNLIEVDTEDSDEEKPAVTKWGILDIFSCVGGKSTRVLRKAEKHMKKRPTSYYEEGDKRKIKKLPRQKDKVEGSLYYFEEPNDDHENVKQNIQGNIYEETTPQKQPPLVKSSQLLTSIPTKGMKNKTSIQPSKHSFVDSAETLGYFVEKNIDSSDDDNSKQWKNRQKTQKPVNSTTYELNPFSSFGKENITAIKNKQIKQSLLKSETLADRSFLENIIGKNSGESVEHSTLDSIDKTTEMTSMNMFGNSDKSMEVKSVQLFENNIEAQFDSKHFPLEKSNSPVVIIQQIPEIKVDEINNLSNMPEVRLDEESLQYHTLTEIKHLEEHLNFTNDVTPLGAPGRFNSSEEYPSFCLNTSAPADFNNVQMQFLGLQQNHVFGPSHDQLDSFNESHQFDLTHDHQSISFDTSDLHQHRRNQRTVSFDAGYHPLQRRISETSVGTEPTIFRRRSTSSVSNPLIYEPWRVKADRKKRSMSVGEMSYVKGVARPVRTRSFGEIYNSTVASSVARRRAKTRHPSDITSRMYQPRQHNRSYSSLGNTSFGYVHPIRQRSFSGFDHSTRSSDTRSRAVTVKRSESDRQSSSESPQRQQVIEDKTTVPLKSDTLKSTDSASGGETLEERSSKEGSPTKEHLSPTKEKKKKKKFHIPSFSKKKNKESKESAA